MSENTKITNEEVFYPDRKMDIIEKRIFDFLNKLIVGQTGPKKAIASKLSSFGPNLFKPELPACAMLFIGPSGSGKNKMAKAISYFLYGKEDAMTIIDCEDPNFGFLVEENYTRYSKPTENRLNNLKYTIDCILKLYKKNKKKSKKGDRDASIKARILGKELSKNKKNFSMLNSRTLNGIVPPIILFENIDKASPDIFNALMSILKRGKIVDTTPDSFSVKMTSNDFSNTLIIMTISGNPTQVADYLKKNGVLGKNYPIGGFSGLPINKGLNLMQIAETIGKRNIIVYRKLKKKEIMKIIGNGLDIISLGLEKRIKFTDDFQEFLFLEATSGLSKDKGAGHVDMVIKEYIQDAIEKLVLSMTDKDDPLKEKFLIFDRVVTNKKRRKEETIIRVFSLPTV